jgi:hypothetical protein
MTLVWKSGYSFDSDASTYIDAVEATDGQALETGVRVAINDFVLGCKQDGIWNAIKASCILAGARTLDGALVPLTGSAPTNSNFVGADYDRETGLKGDGSTKYLDSNRNNNADPQNSRHMATWRSVSETRDTTRFLIATPNGTGMGQLATTTALRIARSAGGDYQISDTTAVAGFWGHSRSDAQDILQRYNNSTTSGSYASSVPLDASLQIFSRSGAGFSNARLSFYSIGESLDLAKLDTRVSNLMTTIGGAI